MGKLNIAHHKSYHPYRRDNIERVRRDEEESQIKEAQEEGRMMLADAEARIQVLRDRAGVDAGSKRNKRRVEEEKERELLSQTTEQRIEGSAKAKGHINFFEDLEMGSIAGAIQRSRELDRLAKRGKDKNAEAELEKGVPLAPSEKDLKPWYSSKDMSPDKRIDDKRRHRDEANKSNADPLTSISRQLAAKYPSAQSNPQSSSRSHSFHVPVSAVGPASNSTSDTSEHAERQSRLTRESSERQRALELIRRKKREAAGNATPSTVHGDSGGYDYEDQYNRRDVEEAHRHRGPARRDARDRSW